MPARLARAEALADLDAFVRMTALPVKRWSEGGDRSRSRCCNRSSAHAICCMPRTQ